MFLKRERLETDVFAIKIFGCEGKIVPIICILYICIIGRCFYIILYSTYTHLWLSNYCIAQNLKTDKHRLFLSPNLQCT